jgi:hypothetical protein
MALGVTEPLTEVNTGEFVGSKVRTVRKADNPTAICECLDVSQPYIPPQG